MDYQQPIIINGLVSELDAVKGDVTIGGGGGDNEGVIGGESWDFGVAG